MVIIPVAIPKGVLLDWGFEKILGVSDVVEFG